MTDIDRAAIERRLAGNEWLSTTDLGALFNRDRSTIYRWAKRGILISEEDPVSRDLAFDPESVRALLAKFAEQRRPRRFGRTEPDAAPPT